MYTVSRVGLRWRLVNMPINWGFCLVATKLLKVCQWRGSNCVFADPMPCQVAKCIYAPVMCQGQKSAQAILCTVS